jgi:branched-chain amino acid transport system substrate-binding protein
MDRRAFLTTAGIGATTLGFPAVLRAQSKDPVRIGCPLPLSGPFAALAKDMQQGAQLAEAELNARAASSGARWRCSSATTSSSRRSEPSAPTS